MKWILGIGLIFFFATNVNAQQKAIELRKDSLWIQLMKDSARIFRKTYAKPYFKFENSISLVSQDQVGLFGFLAGATLAQKHSVSVGYYFLDPFKSNSLTNNDNGMGSFYHFTDLQYFAAGYQFVLYNSRYFLFNIPLTVGFGTCMVDITNRSDQTVTSEIGKIFPTSAGIQLVLKPLKWAGVSGTIGYRNLAAEKNSGLILRGTYYSLGIWMDARHINRNLRYFHKKQNYKRTIKNI